MIGFIKQEQGEPTPRPEYVPYKSNTEAEEAETAEDETENNEAATETKRSFFDKFKF